MTTETLTPKTTETLTLKTTETTKSELHQAMTRIVEQSGVTKGKIAKQKGQMKAAKGKHALMAVARRKAMELGQLGPVCVDDVTDELRKVGLDLPGGARRMWHGTIFSTSEWICIGNMKSRIPDNNARDVKMWALKSWLDSHSLNGTDWNISAFRIAKIYADFKRKFPNVADERCNWLIGLSTLSDETATNIRNADNFMLGIPVTFVNGVGAILQVPATVNT